MVVLDEFSIDAIREPGGRIDAARFPNFASFARGSTWWPNASASHDHTPRAFPAILDGRKPRLKVKGTVDGHPDSVFTLFGDRDYTIVSTEEATDICPPKLCPGDAKRRMGILDNLKYNGREVRLLRWMREIRGRPQPAFYFKHVLLPHHPWLYLPEGRRFLPAGANLAGADGFHDPGLTNHNHERLMLQLGYVDHQLGRLVRRMKREGIFDRSLMVLTADHGASFDVGVRNRRRVNSTNIEEVAPVPFFVKAPRQRRGAVNRAQVRTMDLVPTMLDVLDLDPPWDVEGVSGFSPRAARRDTVRMPTREFDATVEIGAREMAVRRRQTRLRRARLFSTGARSRRRHGDPWASLYRAGPDRRLVGLAAPSAPPGRLRARFAEPQRWSRVRPRARVVPVQVAGVVEGGSRGATRAVAVAVNGRIEATGQTFHLRSGDRSESFSLMIPRQSLRRGQNRIRLVEVRHRGDGLSFRTLAVN